MSSKIAAESLTANANRAYFDSVAERYDESRPHGDALARRCAVSPTRDRLLDPDLFVKAEQSIPQRMPIRRVHDTGDGFRLWNRFEFLTLGGT